MPHQPSKPNGQMKFVSVSLTVDLKRELHAFAEDCTAENLIAYMEEAYLDGYRLGFKGEEVGVSASLTGREIGQSKANAEVMLIERASTVERALKRLFWAHTQIFEKKWPKAAQIADDDW
jgi:hypothetical protein